MLWVITILAVIIAAALFAWAVPLVHLFAAIHPLIIALSIMVAAIFVRLNRGMPTLEWKNVKPEDRKNLTAAIVDLTKEYGVIIGINAAVLIGLVSLSVIGIGEITEWPKWIGRMVSGAVGFLIVLCFVRMAYVVWRDIDIVQLQKRLIDGMADQEISENERKLADENLERIRSANIRPVQANPPKAWGE